MILSTLFSAIAFPEIDPVIFQIGPFAIRWYALAYVAGLIIGWRLMMRLAGSENSRISSKQVDDFLIWATLGVILGGRLGYVLFYKPDYYISNPAACRFMAVFWASSWQRYFIAVFKKLLFWSSGTFWRRLCRSGFSSDGSPILSMANFMAGPRTPPGG